MSAATMEHTFLFPTSRQFPFDGVCEQIVRALEARNWDVPGITVEFDTYGTGEAKFRMVRTIKTDYCKLRFGRPQGRISSNWNNVAAVDQLTILMRDLHIYNDESGPTLYVYVGDDWETDRDNFVNGTKVNSKLRGEPRTYLRYEGACRCSYTSGASFPAVEFLTAKLTGDRVTLAAMTHEHRGRRAPLLVHDNDLGREYDLEPGEPIEYATDLVFAEFTAWLEDNLLPMILAVPEAPLRNDDLFVETFTPMPADVGPIFTFAEYRDAERIRRGSIVSSELDPENRYGFQGTGYRLAAWDVDGDFPKVAYDGFKWCAFGEVTAETPIDELEVPGHYRWSDREQYVCRLNLSHADGVYIADNEAFNRVRREHNARAEAEDRARFTDEELNQQFAARAATIVPITEYDGSYVQPIVLINREIVLDEVELVSGPWPSEMEKQRKLRT